MNPVFGKDYSTSYDLLYEEKDYDGECDLIEKIIKKYSKIPVHSILDLGCGTGNHSLRLAKRGYLVTGVDRSKEMLDIAKAKADQKNVKCSLYQSDIRIFNRPEKYDAIIMMFAVLGYQQENDDVLAVLKTVSKHLNKGGVFICDLWYGPAVLNQKPGERVRVIEKGDTKIIRVSSGLLDIFRHLVTVHFHLWTIKGERIIAETQEDHTMRFFFPQELSLLFAASGLKIQRIGVFPDIETDPGEKTWNICTVSIPQV
ncbi:MAG TPA: class I SAM-dependent methyltransferase [Methanoregula sp.]|nr:class I SAM-dependent methyltransferase [Methanoregula sp.]